MDERQLDRSLALRMDRAWPAFFDRFGRLTNVQRQVIPSILEGQDVLVCSATASGKTEAACAPLIERYMDHIGSWTILYISPTKALINDLYERLDRPVRMLGLRIQRRTGDYRSLTGSTPHLLLTTPESLDSMLCRGKHASDTPHMLSGVVAVVIDEIHLLDGTVRGEQLCWLLERLRKLRSFAKRKGWTKHDRIQVIGLSATLPDPENTLRRYIPGGRMIHIEGRRDIVVQRPTEEFLNEDAALEWIPVPIKKALLDYLYESQKAEKIIVFSNSRRRVDELSAYYRPLLQMIGYSCAAHHGSLSKAYREEAESLAKEAQRVVLFATSTLEIGIDIGDIDFVVLDGPSPDLSSMFQRIGRGNRRLNQTRVMLCSENEADQLIQLALLEAARDGLLSEQGSGVCFTVFPQQIASYIMQSPKRIRTRKAILGLFEGSANSYSEVIPILLDQLVMDEQLIEGPDGYRLGEEWLERAATGKIHSNISDIVGETVIDANSGERIATGVRLQEGNRLLTGGNQLRVTDRYDHMIEVTQASRGEDESGAWGYVSRPKGKRDVHAFAFKRFMRIEDEVWPVLIDNTSAYVFHLGGSKRAAALQLLFTMNVIGADKLVANEWYIRVPVDSVAEKPVWINKGTAYELLRLLKANPDLYERTLGRPSSNRQLPLELRVRELEQWLHLDNELIIIRDSIWTRVNDARLTRALRLIAGITC